jgi:hypothetical protein
MHPYIAKLMFSNLINSKLNSEGKFKKSILISNTFCIPIAIFIL